MADGEVEISGENSGDSPRGELPEGMVPKTTPGKRGRPPGSRNKDTPLNTGSGQSRRVVNEGVDTTEAAKFIGTGFVALIELGETFIHTSCAAKVEKRFPSKLVEFKQMAAQLGLQEKDKEVMSGCVEKIAAKYNFLTAHGPEIVLGVMLAQYGLRQASLIKFVDNVTREKKAEPVADQSATSTKVEKP